MSGPVEAPATRPPLSLAAKARLAAEILATYPRARRALRGGDVRAALRALRGELPAPTEPTRAELLEGVGLGRAVGRTLRLVPAESRCLVRSLVLTSMLARRGIGSSLVIGVKGGDAFGAHAWVELGEQPLLPPGGESYERLVDL